MQKLKGSITISQKQMLNCTDIDDIMSLFQAKGVPLLEAVPSKNRWLEPHPDYTYTEHVDYACHAITITWEPADAPLPDQA